MNRCSLPPLAVLAALALSPFSLSAQALSAQAAPTPASAPVLYAESEAPAPLTSSSSLGDYAAPAPAPAAAAAAASSSSMSSAARVAESESPFSALAFAVKFGIAGVGFDVATPITSWINLRGGASFFTYNTTLVEDGANIAGAIKLQNASIMGDIYPFHNRFRISGGATIFNNTGLNATLAIPGGQSFSLGSTNYVSQPSNPIKGTAAFKFGGNVAPRVSVGFGNMLPRNSRFAMQSEAGFQYISQPTVAYTITGNGCTGTSTGGVYTGCGPVTQSSISQEQTNLQNDLSGLRFFPILSFGVSYKLGGSR